MVQASAIACDHMGPTLPHPNFSKLVKWEMQTRFLQFIFNYSSRLNTGINEEEIKKKKNWLWENLKYENMAKILILLTHQILVKWECLLFNETLSSLIKKPIRSTAHFVPEELYESFSKQSRRYGVTKEMAGKNNDSLSTNKFFFYLIILSCNAYCQYLSNDSS